MDRKAWWAFTIVALSIGVAVGLHPTQPALGGGSQTKITAKEFTFSPKTITAPAGTVQFVVTNAGAVEHTFVIDALKVKSPTIKPGQAATVSVNLKPGSYQVYCDVPGHKELGMVSTISVK
jgi:uncharacterized cupredoxin-like copper-binding protein